MLIGISNPTFRVRSTTTIGLGVQLQYRLTANHEVSWQPTNCLNHAATQRAEH